MALVELVLVGRTMPEVVLESILELHFELALELALELVVGLKFELAAPVL